MATAIAVLLLFAACRETVNTRLDIDQPYSLFGMMNPKSDTHAVRLFEIKSNIALVRPEPLDAVVATTNLDTGVQIIWKDSVVTLDDGDYRHVFWAAFEAAGGETYRLEVVRSDGATSAAVTTIPHPVELEPLEPDTLKPAEAFMPLQIRGMPPSLPRIDVEYVLVGFGEGGSDPVFKSLIFNYVGEPEPDPDGFLLKVDLIRDYNEIYRAFNEDNSVATDIIDLRQINVTVHVGDESWVSPIGVFDPDYLVEPGSFSNVDNGFGYFGSGYTEYVSFRPPVALIRRAGFYVVGESSAVQ